MQCISLKETDKCMGSLTQHVQISLHFYVKAIKFLTKPPQNCWVSALQIILQLMIQLQIIFYSVIHSQS